MKNRYDLLKEFERVVHPLIVELSTHGVYVNIKSQWEPNTTDNSYCYVNYGFNCEKCRNDTQPIEQEPGSV